MEHCGTLVAVCCDKVSWFECRSWAWPLNPQARRAWKCCSQYCLSEGNLYRKIQTRSYTDGSWRERKKEVQSPLAGRMSQANTRSYWEQVQGKGYSQRTGDFSQDDGGRGKTNKQKKPHLSLLFPKSHIMKYANGHKFLADPGRPLGVGFRGLFHTIFVWSDHSDTHCNAFFAFISWNVLFLGSAGCFRGRRLHTWTGLGWFI